MKDTGFSHGGFSGNAPSGPSVELYATVDALWEAADAETLTEGYYRVEDQIVYWNGAAFEPALLRNVPLERYGNSLPADDYAIKVIEPLVFPEVATEYNAPGYANSGVDTGSSWTVL